jgi:galactose-1-phosphate uridylyltransferase
MMETKMNLDKALQIIENNNAYSGEDELHKKLQLSNKIIAQNQKKIWLRAKTGRPMAEALNSTSKRLIELLQTSEETSEINQIIQELEVQTKKLNEESRRRSMVVT